MRIQDLVSDPRYEDMVYNQLRNNASVLENTRDTQRTGLLNLLSSPAPAPVEKPSMYARPGAEGLVLLLQLLASAGDKTGRTSSAIGQGFRSGLVGERTRQYESDVAKQEAEQGDLSRKVNLAKLGLDFTESDLDRARSLVEKRDEEAFRKTLTEMELNSRERMNAAEIAGRESVANIGANAKSTINSQDFELELLKAIGKADIKSGAAGLLMSRLRSAAPDAYKDLTDEQIKNIADQLSPAQKVDEADAKYKIAMAELKGAEKKLVDAKVANFTGPRGLEVRKAEAYINYLNKLGKAKTSDPANDEFRKLQKEKRLQLENLEQLVNAEIRDIISQAPGKDELLLPQEQKRRLMELRAYKADNIKQQRVILESLVGGPVNPNVPVNPLVGNIGKGTISLGKLFGGGGQPSLPNNDPEFVKAMKSYNKPGADKAAIRAEYERRTKRPWPGGN